ncbi:MAG: HAMP domain-containing protein [Burkholderiales bacterium]|nr:HAMP domain-containing protein [Burkholderiales bacterium]
MKYIITICAFMGGVLLYRLSLASANTASFSKHFTLLLGLGGAVVLLLSAVVFYQIYDLFNKIRSKKFGSRLTFRLLMFFSLMSILPGVLVYSLSVQFLSKSIESWFDVRVDKALESGLNLGRTTLDDMRKDLEKRTDSMAFSLIDVPDDDLLARFGHLLDQTGAQEGALFRQNGKIIAYSGAENSAMVLGFPSPSILHQIRIQKTYSNIESIPGKGLYIQVVAPVNVLKLNEDIRVLQVLKHVPKQIAQDAESVQNVYRDYQGLTLSRLGLKRLYGLTLTLSLLLALLCALAVSFYISERLSAPLAILAQGTRAVAQGDFSQYHPVKSRDELGILTQSFNIMTHQLAEARESIQKNHAQVESARAYLESILSNLSSGVLSFDEDFHLKSANPAACNILNSELSKLILVPLRNWKEIATSLETVAIEIEENFRTYAYRDWEKQIEITGKGKNQILLLRGSQLPEGTEKGYLVVFDDITHLVQAQRNAAWGEVARRLAHEIKNPLTPIQLSAERIQHKLADKLGEQENRMLTRSTQTIVNQVAALKNMVDAFSKYAKSSEPNFRETDLNALVREVLTLYESIGVNTQLQDGLPKIRGDETQLRQVIHNLLKNSQDALTETEKPVILVKTTSTDRQVRLTISDNGPGFPDQILNRAFEPYVTTKPKGTGLGLAIVKKIVEEHHGKIQIANLSPNGASIDICIPSILES